MRTFFLCYIGINIQRKYAGVKNLYMNKGVYLLFLVIELGKRKKKSVFASGEDRKKEIRLEITHFQIK